MGKRGVYNTEVVLRALASFRSTPRNRRYLPHNAELDIIGLPLFIKTHAKNSAN